MGLPERGEFWLADLGMAAKTRPVLVVSVPYSDSDYALIGVVPTGERQISNPSLFVEWLNR